MKICGFTFVRNAIRFDYPVLESIYSVLPLCDKFYISVGNSDDGTLELIQSISSSKIEIIQSIWDDSLRKGGRVLAVETNKVLDIIPNIYDWLFYIQADEVLHEKYYDEIKNTMLKWKDNSLVDGLLFNYVHFYGTYNYIADSRNWYRKEIRVIKNDKQIRSYRDAQGFRKNNKKLKVKPVNASIFHYGWVKHPYKMAEKQRNFHLLWHSQEWLLKNFNQSDLFDFDHVSSIQLFKDSHPAVMKNRIDKMNWEVELHPSLKNMKFLHRILFFIEKLTGIRLFEYKNYKII